MNTLKVSSHTNTLIIIPSRIGSTRLKRKALIDMDGKPMVLHVADRAVQAGVGDVYVASDSNEIADVVQNAGYNIIMTDSSIPTGSDRTYAAAKKIMSQNSKKYDCIINLQGDMPMIHPDTIKRVNDTLIKDTNREFDIATAITSFSSEVEKIDENNVSAIVMHKNTTSLKEYEVAKAIYFTRSTGLFPSSVYKHIGIYAYRVEALERFINLPQSILEIEEKLEQLRALENGMMIGCVMVNDHVISIDTENDLNILKKSLNIM